MHLFSFRKLVETLFDLSLSHALFIASLIVLAKVESGGSPGFLGLDGYVVFNV